MLEGKKNEGLNSSQVQERIKEGLVNGNFTVKTKSIKQIVGGNIFTLFNGLNLALAICVILVGSYKNVLFMGVVFWNIVIGVVQEIRSKKVIDKLSLLSAPHARVIRDGVEKEISLDEIVLDDLMVVRNGNEVCADAIILEGECQVNESLLTGESEPVYKKTGDEILSGSFIVSGNVKAQVIHVGKDNYVNQIVSKAKYIKKPYSEILSSIKLIIKIVSFALAPVAALLFANQLNMGRGFDEAVVATVAAVIGMIPSGLVLLISVVLAVSVIKLGQQKVLVQELFCIETLARVDVLCLDKTGTITEGTMAVENIISFDESMTKDDVGELLKAYTGALDDNNPTFEAIRDFAATYKVSADKYKVVSKEGFSSARKYSCVRFKAEGEYKLGAMEFVSPDCVVDVKSVIEEYSQKGLRVLVLALDTKVCALVVVSDKIRKDANDTLNYFKNQGVTLKVISGDNPVTVSYIAKKAGLEDGDNYIDASTLESEEEVKEAALKYSVFGRVTPDQKLIIVEALKANGHTVAMTGDGVNDVMALKEADCSIALGSGSDAARNASQIVLLDSNFKHMPSIVAEGRRSINNIQRSASLYINKTIYSTLLAVIFLFIKIDYPFQPIQLTLIGSLSIGLPSLILALEPNINRVKGTFLGNVARMAIPGGLLVVTSIMSSLVLGFITGANTSQRSTMAVYALAIASAIMLYKVCMPFNKIRRVMYVGFVSIFVFLSVFFKDFFGLAPIRYYQWLAIGGLALGGMVLYIVYGILVEKAMGTTPNIYKVHITFCNGKKVLLVLDDVEPKDYVDVTSQMKGLKVLRADKVIFVKGILDDKISIGCSDSLGTEEIACAAAYFKRKNKGKNGVRRILVEAVDKKYYLTDGENKGEMVIENIDKGKDKVYKPRVLKSLRLTF